MPKSNRTIGAWLSGLQNDDGNSDDTRSVWSGTSIGDYHNRRTVVGGWSDQGRHAVGRGTQSRVGSASMTCREPLFQLSMDNNASGLTMRYLEGVPYARVSHWDRLSSDAPIVVDRVNKGEVLYVPFAASYHVRDNYGLVVAKGQNVLVIDRHFGVLLVDNWNHKVAIGMDEGQIYHRNPETARHLDTLCVRCLNFHESVFTCRSV